MLARFLKLSALALVAGLMTLGASSPAKAAIVEFYTTGAFNGSPAAPGTSPTTITFGTATNNIKLTFTGANYTGANASEPDPFTTLPFGTFLATKTGAGSLENLNGTTFTLYITQTVPSPVSPFQTFTSSISGTISASNSTATVTFSTPLSQIVTASGSGSPKYVTYEVLGGSGTPGVVALGSPNAGPVSVQGKVTATPEPSTIAMAIAALPVVGFVAWRRRRQGAN